MFWQLSVSQYLVAIKVGQRHLRSGNQKSSPLLQPIRVFLKLGQLAGADHAFTSHQMRRTDFHIAVLGGVEVQQKLDQTTMQPCSEVGKADKTGTADFDRTFEIKKA